MFHQMLAKERVSLPIEYGASAKISKNVRRLHLVHLINEKNTPCERRHIVLQFSLKRIKLHVVQKYLYLKVLH